MNLKDSSTKENLDLLTGITSAALVLPRTMRRSYMIFWGTTLIESLKRLKPEEVTGIGFNVPWVVVCLAPYRLAKVR